MGYAFAARQLGAQLLTGHEVEAIERARRPDQRGPTPTAKPSHRTP